MRSRFRNGDGEVRFRLPKALASKLERLAKFATPATPEQAVRDLIRDAPDPAATKFRPPEDDVIAVRSEASESSGDR